MGIPLLGARRRTRSIRGIGNYGHRRGEKRREREWWIRESQIQQFRSRRNMEATEQLAPCRFLCPLVASTDEGKQEAPVD